jgi:hypothetical protein
LALDRVGRLPACSLTRRQALVLAAGAAVAVAAPRLPGSAASAAPALRRSTYGPLVGERFAVRSPEGVVARLRLVEVSGREAAFALRFDGGGAPRLAQDVHTVRHPAIGRADLLLVPVGRGVRTQEYEIVINRLRA